MPTRGKAARHIDEIIGRNVRIHRLAKHLSQSKLADHLGVTFQQVQKYENGTNRIGSGRLMQIASFLKVPLMQFFLGVEGGPSSADPSVLRLIVEPHSLRLVQAFANIPDRGVRLSLVELVEGIATKKRS